MIKPHYLQKGDKVAIVSLSSGVLGEDFCKHELELGTKRLQEMGLEPVFMPNSLKGMDYIKNHPEARANDLKQTFMDSSIKGIITAIGGDDTYRTIPYLLDDEEFKNAVLKNPKVFIGFSDTTNNHIMFYKLGLRTYYGPCFLPDIAELDQDMLPYTKDAFNHLFRNDSTYEIVSSPVWYMERESFGPEQLGIPRKSVQESHGFEVLNGRGVVTGTLFGGCIESLFDAYTSERYGDEHSIYEKYHLLPTLEEYKDMVLFIETSEEKMKPEKLLEVLTFFKNEKILSSVKGILVGKPMDEEYYDSYKEIYQQVFSDLDTPVLFNLNFGHATPRCILPYGAQVEVNYDLKTVKVLEKMFSD